MEEINNFIVFILGDGSMRLANGNGGCAADGDF